MPSHPQLRALEDARKERREEESVQLYELLMHIWELVDDSREPALTDEQLKALSIRKGAPLDVDQDAPFDPEPLFFPPLPIEEGQDVRSVMLDAVSKFGLSRWHANCTRTDCQLLRCAEWRYHWVLSLVGGLDYFPGFGLLGKSKWVAIRDAWD
ncbi:hypothetical protein diail_4708 [Diaporthe ilicicola]|nr:hypothetical protein diail_4708 [Diaporthe ilicicola]